MATVRGLSRRNVARQVTKNPDLNALISERAYRIFEDKGWTHGHDLDDWLEAERQVLTGIKKKRRI